MATYRVWVNAKRGDDYYYTFNSQAEAKKFASTKKNAEKVVYLAKGRGITATEKPIPLKDIKSTPARQQGNKNPFGFSGYGIKIPKSMIGRVRFV